jgi:hypothetical protein
VKAMNLVCFGNKKLWTVRMPMLGRSLELDGAHSSTPFWRCRWVSRLQMSS